MFKFILFLLLLLAATNNVNADVDGSGPQVGQPVPKLYGRTLVDSLYSLSKDVGQAKVINFFWIECHPCREEMPELARLEKKYKSVKFISAHTSLNKKAEEPESVAIFIKSLKGAPSNIVLTTSSELGKDFNISGLPHTIILDENNVVLQNITGYDKQSMLELVSTLDKISKKP
jgi:thiol-disulfide isomerase/thioredoxin